MVRFVRKVHLEKEGTIEITAQGDYTVSLMGEIFESGEKKCWGARQISLPAGDYALVIRVMNTETFPALYITGAVESDASWLVDDTAGDFRSVGCSDLFTDKETRPEVFPFEEEEIRPVSAKTVSGGILYDFGKETFGVVKIAGTTDDVFGASAEGQDKLLIRLGESEEEALDPEWCVIRFEKEAQGGVIELPPSALRYLWIGRKNTEAGSFSTDNSKDLQDIPVSMQENLSVSVRTQMLPLVQQSSFRCEDETINRVYDVAEYTFHLNCREFFLDGIKRDGWVWSADSYQCLFVNHYLYMDPEIEKRTLTQLGGGLPVVQYINTIMDYSYFWLMSLRDYYLAYGDADYIRQIYPMARAVMLFCDGRTSEDGFIRGRKEDWVFIDWAPMDKDGALLGEQVLLAEAMKAFSMIEKIACAEDSDSAQVLPAAGQGDSRNTEISSANGAGFEMTAAADPDVFSNRKQKTETDWEEKSRNLKEKIVRYFYDPDLGVFVDNYETGKKNVTRQNNILAYLYLDLDRTVRKDIYERVVCNDAVPAITTPYFKFYENQVYCEEGSTLLEDNIREYYGSMLALGATTLYEQYDPAQTGAEHYSMYGRPFEKSLCHAWSCSPIYLLGRYRLGVRNTGTAYETFEVAPNLGNLNCMEGTVPVRGGEVKVQAERTGDGRMRVKACATVPGGTLIVNGQRYPMDAGTVITV